MKLICNLKAHGEIKLNQKDWYKTNINLNIELWKIQRVNLKKKRQVNEYLSTW